MRVAIFTETYIPCTDGVVTRLLNTLDELRRLGHEVLVLAPDGGPPSYAGYRVEGFPGRPFFLYPDKRVIWPRTRGIDLVREFQPDVIHTLNPTVFGMAAILAAWATDRPLVASYHTHFPHYAKLYGYDYLTGPIWGYMRLLHNRAAVNLCTSESARQELVRHRFRRVRVWPHGVDLRRFRPTTPDPAMRHRLSGGAPDKTLLVYVGRLAAEKEIHRLLPAVQGHDEIRLALVGDGPSRRELEVLFAGTPTVFTGTLEGDDLVAAYNAADAFLFPSTTETLGLVLLEAMACGLPAIAARSEPSMDLLGGGEAGILYDGDDPRSLVAAITRFRGDPEHVVRLRQEARRRGSERGWEAPTRKLVGYYHEAVEHVAAALAPPFPVSGQTGAGGR